MKADSSPSPEPETDSTGNSGLFDGVRISLLTLLVTTAPQ